MRAAYAPRTNARGGRDGLRILERAGFQMLMDKRRTRWCSDRINNTQSNLCSGSGYRALHMHPRCEALVKGAGRFDVEKGNEHSGQATGLDHMPDALGYVLWQQFNVLAKHIPAVAPVTTDLPDSYLDD
jgi:hypothetical protein